jgi:hypothetical protein
MPRGEEHEENSAPMSGIAEGRRDSVTELLMKLKEKQAEVTKEQSGNTEHLKTMTGSMKKLQSESDKLLLEVF